jgi:hypothetical protein
MNCPICGNGPCIRGYASSKAVERISSEYNFVAMSDTYRDHRVMPVFINPRDGEVTRPHGSFKIGANSGGESYFLTHRAYLTARKENFDANATNIATYRAKYVNGDLRNPRLDLDAAHASSIGIHVRNPSSTKSRFSIVYNRDNDTWYELTGFPKEDE